VTRRLDVLAPAVVFVLGLATILGAWGFELIGGYVPCALCLQERVPYYVGLPLVLVALIASSVGAPGHIGRYLLLFAGLVFLIGAGLGVYHAGAEWGWWAGPSTCGGGTTGGSGNLLEQLDNIRVVSCTEASWRFAGLSFAGWNAVISLLLAIGAFWGAFHTARDGQPAGPKY
jgi:disulfide bond formation protein DsbB